MQEREKQLDHYDALDTKAGVLLAFAGVLIVAARGIQFGYLVPGMAFAALSAILSLTTFWPRKFPTLDPWELRQFLTYDTEAAGLKVHDTIAAAVSRGAPELLRKGRYLKGALVLLLLAAVTFGIGILSASYNANPGRIHYGNQPSVRSRTSSPVTTPARIPSRTPSSRGS